MKRIFPVPLKNTLVSVLTNIVNWSRRAKRRGLGNVSVSGRFFWQRLLTLLPGALLPLLLFGIVIIFTLRSSISAWTDANNRNSLLQTQSQIELIIGEIDSLNITFSVNFDITRILMHAMLQENYDNSQRDVNKLTTNYLIPAVASRPYVHSLYIYMDNPYGRFLTDSDYLVTLDTFYDTSWYENYQLQKEMDKHFNSDLRELKRYSFEKQTTHVITLYKRFFMHQGVVIMNLNKSYFDKQLAERTTHASQLLMAVNAEGEVLMQSNPAPNLTREDIAAINTNESIDIPAYKLNGQYYQVTRVFSSLYDWTFLSMVPLKDLYSLPDHLVFFIFLAMMITATICLLYSIIYAKRTHASIMKIFSLLDAMEHFTPLPAITPHHNDAYSTIMHNIVKNIAEQSNLKRQLEQKQYEARFLELTALRAQINPHFLFNTLQSIYWMSFGQNGGPNEVSSMIENMTGILQYSMDDSDELVPLGVEIQNTQAYISLQHMRYQDRFEVAWDVDEAAKRYFTIKLLLQPLVENAIVHGIDWETKKTLHISIIIRMMEEIVSIQVEDDGCGISPDQLDKIHKKMNSQSDDGHIGITNCHRRLCLTFGHEYGIKLISKDGLTVLIRLPKMSDSINTMTVKDGTFK